MAGYLIANIDVTDADAFAKYRAGVTPLIAKFGGRYLVRGAPADNREGRPMKRIVVLEFPTLAQAQKFYESDEYAPLLKLRLDSSVSDLALVEGYTE
jgi:uncharacterized protein (DUF1330 family)